MAERTRAFDWPAVMRACMGAPAQGGLGWPPVQFWAATPREVAAALGPSARIAAPDRAALERLLATHPDQEAADDARE